MKGQKEENVFLRLIVDGDNWMNAFRQNIGILRSYYGWSVRVLAEKANISESTINKIIQGISKDCDQSLTVKLAKAFGISVDELIGARTINDETRKVIAMTRVLEEHHRKMIRIYAKHQYILHKKNNAEPKTISVLIPKCIERRLKRVSLSDEKIVLDKLTKETQEKISFGIKIPCDHYEPHYLKDEIILLGYDREGENNETCVVSSGGYIYICIKKVEFVNGKKETNYVSITNKKKIFSYDEIDDRFGYVVGWLEPDGEWGER